MHLCYERPGLVSALNNTGVSGYDKWNRDRGGGAGGGAGDAGAWAARDRDRERERERQARAHQMSHVNAPEPDASSLFPAPFRVKGNNDMWAQQIHNKLGDYNLAHSFIEDTSKSIIGICAEPASPAPCPPSRRESEFKKPAHAPQNGRVHHHRPYVYNKSEVPGSTGASGHRPSKLLINGFNQSQNSIDSSQPPIESILKEMKDIPPPLSGIAATPRKETDNKFVFNDALNRLVQDNSQNNDLIRKSPPPKPGLDNRISNSRTSVSPDVNKDLCLSGSDDEVAATTTRLEPIVSPIVSGSPSSGSESSPSDSESDSSSGESSSEARAPAPPPPSSAPPPPKSEGVSRPSWSLSNFAPPAPHPASPPQTYDSTKELRHALADVKGKPQSPISELSESPVSSPSPRRRRSAQPQSVSSDDDAPPEHNTSSPRLQAAAKRGRPRKKSTSEPPRKRGRPPKPRPAPRAPTPEPDRPNTDTKTQIFRKVFIPKNECGGKGGKGGKGKGGKGKGQVTIIEATAPESGAEDEERRRLEERRQEAIARLSPERRREEKVNERLQDRRTVERSDHRRSDERPADRPVAAERPLDRIPTERTSNDRMERDRGSGRMSASERLPSDRLPSDRHTSDRLSSERLPERLSSDRMPERLTPNRMTSERLTPNRIPSERLTPNRMPERLTPNRIPERLTVDRIPSERRSSERLPSDRLSSERPTDRLSDRPTDRLSSERLPDRLPDRLSSDRLSGDKLSLAQKMSQDKLDRLGKLVDRLPDRFVRAEADVGSGLKSRGSERLEEASSLVERPGRARVVVQVPLRRLRADTQRALARRRAPRAPRAPQPKPQNDEVAATNHERSACADQTPVYYSYFECLPADALSDEERDSEYYLSEAKRLRTEAVSEQEPLNRVMLYLESVLCFVLTGRVLELEHDTKRAFTIYRETIEYIKSIHSMPSRFRASPHSTFSKLDILSLRVQALLYLRMFKMYNREVKDYYKIVQEYQQKPACAESVSSVSPLSPSPSPASVGSVGSGSASSGYCSLAHAVPATAHHALLQLTKYYTFLYVAHELWEQADQLCRMKPNQDLFIAVDRKCGPLTLSSSFRHLVQYVRHAITLLQKVPRE